MNTPAYHEDRKELLPSRAFFVNLIISCLVIFGNFQLNAQDIDLYQCRIEDPEGRSREHELDMLSLKLELAFRPEEGLVLGKAAYNFESLREDLDSIWLDAPGINVSVAWLNGNEIPVKHHPEGISLHPFEKLQAFSRYTLTLRYQANPQKGLYFVGWNDPFNINRKQIWSQGQGIDNRHWIPSYDYQNDKLITECLITFDDTYQVISNGKLVDFSKNEDASITWHYKMDKPHASYLMMLAIGEYAFKDLKSESGVTIRQFYYPKHPETFEATYQYSAEMFNWFENILGIPYPWGKQYSNVPVQDYMYGAMENTTATIFTDYYLQDARAAIERNYLGTNAHELAHQWFGDYVTAWSGKDHWLQESFATYYAKEFRKTVLSDDEYQWIRYQESQNSINADNRDLKPVVHSKAGSSRHYSKGSFILGMLKDLLGDESFNRSITHYLEQYPYQNVDTHNFYQAFLATLGINPDWFFEQWLYKSGYPKLKIQQIPDKNQLILIVEQVQETGDAVGYFKLPLEIQIYCKDESFTSHREWISDAFDTLSFPIPPGKDFSFFVVDPGMKLLRTLEYERPVSQILAQAQYAENMLDRYEALLQLRNTEVSLKEDELMKVFEQDNFYAIKGEIIKQLVNDSKFSTELISSAIADKDPLLRRSLIENLDNIPESLKGEFTGLLKDSSYVNIEKALSKLSLQYPEDVQNWLDLTDDVEGMNHNVEIAKLEAGATIKARGAMDQLVELSSPSREFRTRINAMDALNRLEFFSSKFAENLLDGFFHFNSRLNSRAKSYLNKLINKGHGEEIKTLISEQKLSGDQLQKVKDQLGL